MKGNKIYIGQKENFYEKDLQVEVLSVKVIHEDNMVDISHFIVVGRI